MQPPVAFMAADPGGAGGKLPAVPQIPGEEVSDVLCKAVATY
jgi:hypothetical protein